MIRAQAWLPLCVCTAFGTMIGVSAYTFRYAEGLSYLSDDPAACVNCHIMRDQYESWLRSSHRIAATCNDCHVPHTFPGKYLSKMQNGWNHSKAFTLQNFEEPIRIHAGNLEVLQQNCIACHEVAVSAITAHAGFAAGRARCTDCHRGVGHMSTY